MALRKEDIKAAVKSKTEGWLKDEKVAGLGVLVTPKGAATWYLRYRLPDGKQEKHKIGPALSIPPETARDEAHKVLGGVAKGETPTKDRRTVRRGKTVAELCDLVKAEHYAKRRKSTVVGYMVLWNNWILPEIGSIKVASLETLDVLELLKKMPKTQANRALAVLRKAMNLAELWNLRPKFSNPCKGIEGNGERKIKRYLTRDELERLLKALDAFGTTPVRWRFAQLVRLLLLTGCRVGEIKNARWSWLDEDATVLTVPAEEHKTGQDGNPRIVHIPPEACLILRDMRRKSNSDWIIQGDGDHPLVGYARLWQALLTAAQVKNLRIHDLRHSYASYAISKAKLTLPEVGGLLGHASPQTTQRYAHLIDEAAAKAAAMVAAQLRR